MPPCPEPSSWSRRELLGAAMAGTGSLLWAGILAGLSAADERRSGPETPIRWRPGAAFAPGPAA